jgi:chromosome segregation ATPase
MVAVNRPIDQLITLTTNATQIQENTAAKEAQQTDNEEVKNHLAKNVSDLLATAMHDHNQGIDALKGRVTERVAKILSLEAHVAAQNAKILSLEAELVDVRGTLHGRSNLRSHAKTAGRP